MLGSIRGISCDENVFFVDQLVFYYNNCPEVPKGTFPFTISIFQNSVEFVDQVQRLSMDVERLATVSIEKHRYDPDFPTRKHFEGFSADPFISKHLLPWIDVVNPLLDPTTATLRKVMFEKINSNSYQLGYSFDHSFTIHQYIMNVMDRLMTMFSLLTDKKTPLIIRPARSPIGWGDDTHEDMRYTSDQMIVDYHLRLETLDTMQLKDDYEMVNPYLKHSLEELVSYRLAMKRATPNIRHANSVVFAYCMQRWCEVIHSYYFDIEFYKKIRPDQNKPNSTFILNDVCKVVMQIESIMLYVMQKTKEMIAERMALQAVSPEDGPFLTTATTVIKGQTAELRNGTVTVNDVISLLHKSGF
jgi:hypothetical protein